jgi:gliding motility-associated-like protein
VSETNIVCVEGPPVASFYANPPIITDPTQWIQFSNNSFGAVDYEWNFGDGQNSNLEQPQHLYTDINDGFIITLIASSELGCLDTAQVSIIYQEEPIVYIPNTFTPDGDQYNHVFLPVFTSGYDPFNYEMLIFNRWGEIVFESRDVNVGWDGTYGLNGTDAQDGAYTYKIIYKVLKTDERRLLVGHVNLIR